MVSRQGEPAVAAVGFWARERYGMVCYRRWVIPPTQASNNTTAVRAGGLPPPCSSVTHTQSSTYLQASARRASRRLLVGHSYRQTLASACPPCWEPAGRRHPLCPRQSQLGMFPTGRCGQRISSCGLTRRHPVPTDITSTCTSPGSQPQTLLIPNNIQFFFTPGSVLPSLATKIDPRGNE